MPAATGKSMGEGGAPCWMPDVLVDSMDEMSEIEFDGVDVESTRCDSTEARSVVIPTLSSLIALVVVIMTTFCATNKDKVGIVTTPGF